MLLIFFLCFSCTGEQKKKEVVLYETYCASCHLAPAIADLPKHIWEQGILPEMGARLGIRENGFNPYKGVNFNEQAEMIKTGIYPSQPMIDQNDWTLLKAYIIAMAPDSLLPSDLLMPPKNLEQFEAFPITVDEKEGTMFSYLHVDDEHHRLILGDIASNLLEYNIARDTIIPLARLQTPLVDFSVGKEASFATVIGSLAPTALKTGAVIQLLDGKKRMVSGTMHRPVHTLVQDLNNDGHSELVVSEFGDLTGELSLLVRNENMEYDKRVILKQAGTLKVIAKDMDHDGALDLIVSTSQGDEGITILYQLPELRFRAEKVIRLSPVYGTSWFELIDYDGDGDDDIVTVNGDNADESYVHKPYHGVRLFINDGNNNFEQKYFYPINGATRVLADDFDQDGDVDFAVLSTFPDYEHRPEQAFVYLENTNENSFEFVPNTFDKVGLGRWFLMDSGDVDQDGDIDIVLSAFSFGFTTVPDDLSQYWKEQKVDLMVLKNKLIEVSEQ